jgi:hypothetical protein
MLRPRLAAIVILGFLQWGCKNNPVEPLKDPRTYTWSIDTLAYPGSFQTSMRDIWASSPQSVWIVGHNDRGFGKMFHYDGKEWKPVDLAFGGIDLSAIYGFGADNIFAVGERIYYNPTSPPNFLDSSLIIHFDGRQWREHRTPAGRHLLTIFGNSPNDVWAAGGAGTLFHYDGTRWSKFPMDAQYDFFDMGGLGKELYMLGRRDEGPPGDLTRGYRVLFGYDGSSWRAIDSVHVLSDLFYRVAAIGNTWYTLGYGVWALRGGVWQKELTTANVLQGYYAVSPSNVFVVGQQSLIYHYDGQTWQQLRDIVGGGWWLHAVWATEREAFIVGHDAGGFKTIVLHGK